MYYFKTVLGVVFGVVVFLFLDYALPSKNTVRITNTYNKLTSVDGLQTMFFAGADTGTVRNDTGQRDIRFVDTVRPNGKVFVYRNEDTGWIWPPYFKYDSSNLHSEATNLKSGKADAQWVSVTAYGWRIAWLSIYPNVISIDTVAGPGEAPRNWAAMVILGILFVLLMVFWRMWAQFRQRTIDPVMDSVDEHWDNTTERVGAGASGVRSRIARWFGKSGRR